MVLVRTHPVQLVVCLNDTKIVNKNALARGSSGCIRALDFVRRSLSNSLRVLPWDNPINGTFFV